MKKRNFTYYFFLVLFYMVFSARSCGDGTVGENYEFNEQVRLIENSMRSEEPDSESLHAFVIKAEQKIIDLGEYFSLIYDPNIDSTLKNNVVEQMKGLFVEGSNRMEIINNENKVSKSFSVSGFRISHLLNTTGPISFSNESIQITQALQRQDKDSFSGKLQFEQRIEGDPNGDKRWTSDRHQEADYYVKKTEKIFGSDTLFVWQVFLGDIVYLDE